jgi:hypothetical protein
MTAYAVLPVASFSSSADSFVMEAVIVCPPMSMLHFDNLAFELVTSAEFHGSLLSSAAAKIARDGV